MPKMSAKAKAAAPDAEKLEVVYRKTSDLIGYARNARTHSEAQVAQIAASIREFGFTNPILLDGNDGILAGHGRVAAARLLGLAEVPTIDLAHLTETQRRAYILADNKLALNAGWDAALLKLELDELQELDFPLALTGFEIAEVSALEAEVLPEVKGQTDEDAVPEVKPDPVTRLGDVWLLGRHRVMCGDSTSIDAVEKLMAGEKADMVFTDPPYNVGYVGKTKDNLTISNDDLGDSAFSTLLQSALGNAYLVMADGAPIYVCGPLEDGAFLAAFRAAGLKLQSVLVWLKNAIVLGRKDYHYKHEPILYGWKEGAAHNWFGGRDKATVFECQKPPRNGAHPTMKPVELVTFYCENSSKADAAVLDLFGGSGTTAIACEKLNRQARLMELAPTYCDVIVRRWQEFTGQQATLEGDGRTFDAVAAAGKRAA
jgi:DNA modification methylase